MLACKTTRTWKQAHADLGCVRCNGGSMQMSNIAYGKIRKSGSDGIFSSHLGESAEVPLQTLFLQ